MVIYRSECTYLLIDNKPLDVDSDESLIHVNTNIPLGHSLASSCPITYSVYCPRVMRVL